MSNPETESMILEQRVNGCIGEQKQTILARVLAQYPSQAELFIKTQDYARARVSAEHYTEAPHQLRLFLRNNSQSLIPFKDLEDLVVDDSNLEPIRGYCARQLVYTLKCITAFRDPDNNRGSAFALSYFRQVGSLNNIKSRQSSEQPLTDYENMILKALELARVTEEEFAKMVQLIDVSSKTTYADMEALDSFDDKYRKNNPGNNSGWYLVD